jgi:hypothetical protein
MKLRQILKICLLALDSRYPESMVKANETMLGHYGFWKEACTPTEMLEVLQQHAPELLAVPACLVIDAKQCAIYLVEQSEEVPAFWVDCEGLRPSREEHQQLQSA